MRLAKMNHSHGNTGRERLIRPSREGLTPRVFHESSNFLAHDSHN